MSVNKKDELYTTYEPYYVFNDSSKAPNWKNGDANVDGNTPIIAEALNQLERQLKEVYDAVGQIETPNDESTTPLQSAVSTYKDSVNTRFTNLLDSSDTNGQTAKKATSVDITTQEAADAVVKFQVGSGTAYEKTINNVAHASSAQQLDGKPELTAYNEDNTITITAGEKTSDKFTVPFATETSKLQNSINITLTGDVTGSVDTQFATDTSITTQLNVPVVTYTTTDEDYAAADEIVFVCGGAPTN